MLFIYKYHIGKEAEEEGVTYHYEFCFIEKKKEKKKSSITAN